MCTYSCSREGHLWLGLVAFVIGAVILLQRFDIVPVETWDYLWPSILLVTGIKLMIIGEKKNDSPCEGVCEDPCEDVCGTCGDDSCEGICEKPMVKKSMKKKSGKKK